jgi:glycosyltransferase involved in cell wall biosynthesis
MPQNKKIAFFSPGLYPCRIGGMEIFDYYLIKETARHRQVLLFTSCGKVNIPNVVKCKITSRLFGIRRCFCLGKASIVISTFFQVFWHRHRITLFNVPYSSNSGFLGTLFPLIKKILHIEYILVIHTPDMKPWARLCFDRALFKHAMTIFAVSERQQTEYAKRSGRQVRIVLPLIPFIASKKNKRNLKKKYGFDVRSKIVLMLASIKLSKGSDVALDAFLKLGKVFIETHNLHLIFCGTGVLENKLRSIAMFSAVSEYVHFFGTIKYNLVNEIYKIADIYITASWYEGTSISLLEAMFNGLPIIGSNVGGVNNMVIDNYNGLLFEKDNRHDLKEKIKMLIEQQDLARYLSSNVKKWYNANYNKKNIYGEFEKVYSDIY